jgi:hypothetical protein
MSDFKNNPEWRAAAHNLNDSIKKLHKQVDKVGYKSEEGQALLAQDAQLRVVFAEKWGIETLVAAKFLKKEK